MTAARWRFTPHAKQRRREMHLTEDAVLAVVAEPRFDTPDVLRPGRRRAFGDDLVVVYDPPPTSTVVTVLYRSDTPFVRPEKASSDG